MDIGDWLQSLGLERYEAAFRENEIDETVLPTVTAEDLKDLGVDVVGHRRKLLNAICQSASKFDPLSASKFDPLWRRVLAVAIAPSEVVGVAETARAPAVV